jgi:hypothetical protein
MQVDIASSLNVTVPIFLALTDAQARVLCNALVVGPEKITTGARNAENQRRLFCRLR